MIDDADDSDSELREPYVQDSRTELRHWQLVRYLHDCLAAQTDWARAINIVAQRDITTLPLSTAEHQKLAAEGKVRLSDTDAIELGKRVTLFGDRMSLVLGALFLTGTVEGPDDQSGKQFCAPLLEVPIELEIKNDGVVVTPGEVEFSVNYSLVGELLSAESDDLQDRLSDLAESVPDFPIVPTEFQYFWNQFQLIAPEVPITHDLPEPRKTQASAHIQERFERKSPTKVWNPESLEIIDFYMPKIPKTTPFRLLPATALILGPKAGRSMSALAELRAMTEMPLSRTAFGCMFDPPSALANIRPVRSNGNDPDDIYPLPLSPSQRSVVESARTAPLTVVTGPPGTGKSHTITAITLDALRRGQTVLIASQMDKAVEVVADQVESIAGPLAIARSGGRSAQRQLAKKISELTGPRNRQARIAADSLGDCEREHFELKRKLQQLEHAFGRILDAEDRWSELHRECEQSKPLLRLPVESISKHNVRTAERKLQKIQEHESANPNFFRRWLTRRAQSRVYRELGLPKDTLAPMRDVEALLRFHLMLVEMDEIEESLGHALPADQAWNALTDVEKQLQESAIRYLQLTRQRQVRSLVSDHYHRSSLRDLAASLRRRREDLKAELQGSLTAELLLDAFPAWACTSRSLCEVLPANPRLFDLVVIDEASQCDLALASVALMRGKRAVVVGDPNQLRHVCFLSRAREQASFVRNEIPIEVQRRFHFRRSLFDVAADMVDDRNFFFLEEHFRSHPHIIDFSNRHFYEGALSVMTGRPSNEPEAAIETRYAEGRRDPESSVNLAEIRVVFEALDSHINTRKPCSIGIISPFRDQADAIRERLARIYPAEILTRHSVVVGTAHSLQGDEKDVVIMSTSIDPDSHSASLRFLESPNLFNVAITRARRRLIVVTSVTQDDLPTGLFRDFLIHASGSWKPQAPIDDSNLSGIERIVVERLVKDGLACWPKFRAAGTTVDVVAMSEHESVAILCDRAGNPDWEARLSEQRRLARAGWPLVCLQHRSIVNHWRACRASILKRLDR